MEDVLPLAALSANLAPPQQAFGQAYAVVCPRLSQEPLPESGPGTAELLSSCATIVGAANPELNGAMDLDANVDIALRQTAAEEVATQGTNFVETSNDTIGARLAALRRGATGISLQRFALQVDDHTLPGTLVASLLPYVADAKAESAAIPALVRRLGLFANGTFSFGNRDETSREAGFDFETLGVTLGVDYRVTNNVVLGVAFGYISADADLDASGGSVDTQGVTASLYGTYYLANAFYVDGIASAGWNDYDVDRTIRYSLPSTDINGIPTGGTTTVDQTATADTDGTQYALSVGAGYDFTRGGLTFGPFVRVNYLRLDIDGYREEIDNTQPGFGLALDIDDQDVESLTTVLGGQASFAISVPWGVILPQVRLTWEHEFKNDSRTLTAKFVDDPGGDPNADGGRTPIRFATDKPDRNFVNLGVGLSAVFARGRSAFLLYETVLGLDDVTAHNIVLGIRIEL